LPFRRIRAYRSGWQLRRAATMGVAGRLASDKRIQNDAKSAQRFDTA
jgi:hypothetical protein